MFSFHAQPSPELLLAQSSIRAAEEHTEGVVVIGLRNGRGSPLVTDAGEMVRLGVESSTRVEVTDGIGSDQEAIVRRIHVLLVAEEDAVVRAAKTLCDACAQDARAFDGTLRGKLLETVAWHHGRRGTRATRVIDGLTWAANKASGHGILTSSADRAMIRVEERIQSIRDCLQTMHAAMAAKRALRSLRG